MAKTDTILKLSNLTKTFILGNKKNAKKAQKELLKLHKKYEKAVETSVKDLSQIELDLKRAQNLFAEEKFEECYKCITGKSIKNRPRDRGVVVHALNGINLEINKGDLVAIVGPSGSGKSTLLNMLGLLDTPTSGQIFINGRNVTAIKNKDLPDIRSNDLGFVFQSFNLVSSLTALENVMLPLRYAGVSLKNRRIKAQQALEQVGLGDRMQHTPNELSGGQQQRVAIARSIVNNPAIIFGDELTGELDSKMTKNIMDLINQLNKKGQTIIIVTHNQEVAKRCKRVIYMKDGKIIREVKNKV